MKMMTAAVAIAICTLAAAPVHAQQAPPDVKARTQPTPKPSTAPRLQVKVPVEQVRTNLRQVGPMRGQIECMTSGKFKAEPYTRRGGEVLDILMPFTFSNSRAPGTCSLPAGQPYDRWGGDYMLRMEVPASTVASADFMGDRPEIVSGDMTMGRWLTAFMGAGGFITMDVHQAGGSMANSFIVDNVVDGPRY